MRGVIDAILLIFALIFAVKTYGLSVIAWFVYLYIKNRIAVKHTRYRVRKNNALKKVSNLIKNSNNDQDFINQLEKPSWLKERADEFFYSVSKIAVYNGIPEKTIRSLFSNIYFLSVLSGIAAAMEQEGGSFLEQQNFIVDILVDAYKNGSLTSAANDLNALFTRV